MVEFTIPIKRRELNTVKPLLLQHCHTMHENITQLKVRLAGDADMNGVNLLGLFPARTFYEELLQAF